ncbi:hypothetical protein [Sporolactobacillus terrae]|uniref:Uncharacterized protein n=1 Tax=Sporolactobacillus terrae TaxID=269673 RepID=A0A5K7X0K6_9BACL|nr:hypothetical protein [Sporolactobacillus terrae]UAK15585.1 hypothetical protein K7399_11080 [Sporolactobacillus terrae]BBO00043.1 hypothetical protein St703_27470 [Sporolactobacillus terrae]
MLSDFERKLRQIILNDLNMGRTMRLDDLAQRTGHDKQEIVKIIEGLKQIPIREGGLGS